MDMLVLLFLFDFADLVLQNQIIASQTSYLPSVWKSGCLASVKPFKNQGPGVGILWKIYESNI